MSALDDRRQAALEAGEDADPSLVYTYKSIEVAIETATRVRITPEILGATGLPPLAAYAVVHAAFRAAGFEVEE